MIKTFISFILVGATAIAASQDTGPHGGAVVQDSSHKFEINLDPSGKSVSVFTLRSKDGPPKKMAITLFRESGTDQTIDLKAIDTAQTSLPKFQGELSPNAGSFVGVELRFQTSFKSTMKVLKLMPYIPP